MKKAITYTFINSNCQIIMAIIVLFQNFLTRRSITCPPNTAPSWPPKVMVTDFIYLNVVTSLR